MYLKERWALKPSTVTISVALLSLDVTGVVLHVKDVLVLKIQMQNRRETLELYEHACTNRHTYIQTDRKTDRQTDRHTDTQTDIHASIHTYIHTYT